MLVAGNWKMNLDLAAARQLTSGVVSAVGTPKGTGVALCPPFVDLDATYSLLHGTGIRLGAQNMHEQDSGAFTGEISAPMLRAVGCHYVILGHSERRQLFGETNESVNKKALQALSHRLVPIVCVGESLEQRDADRHNMVVEEQVRAGLANLEVSSSSEIVVAYEPVWAIGTGRTATPDQVQDMHGHIRSLLQDIFNEAIGSGIDILYGGSVKPGNAAELFERPNVDGGLIGGAALNAEDFAAIVRCAEEAA
ncbi:MAG: triose-phosphate isomerase [Rhodothermales bacterium]|nr:triose-phosphate isomerase [Rhodothermales bacterium]MDG2017436.1 triose-phosphate isomerase [Rhodothermales bacterium]